MTDCPGSCNAWWRNLTPHQQEASEIRPRQGDPVWCHPDQARIHRMLGNLDDLAALLEHQITGYGVQARSPARGANQASPAQVALDLDELDTMLTGWEDAYRDWYNRSHPGRPWLSRPYRGVLTTLRHGTVCWLSTNLRGILASDLAQDFGLEVVQWHREFVAKTRAGSGHRRSMVPCPACGLRTLAWADGHDGLVCGNCNRHVPKDEHKILADAATQHHLEHAG